MSILILLRHGQSLWNLENRFTGTLDIELSPLGLIEAADAGELLKGYKIDMAYTSTLKRAIHTLDIVMKVFKSTIPVKRTPLLNERCYGKLQGLNKAEVEKKYGTSQYLLWRRSYEIAPPDGESLKNVFERIIPFFVNEIQPMLKADKNILIVAHGNSLRALMMFLEAIPPEQILTVEIATGIPRKYSFDKDLKLIAVSYITKNKQ